MYRTNLRYLTITAMLAAIICLTGIIKLPALSGTEFHLSAPISVVIAACFSFKQYLFAGIISSLLSLLLGLHSPLNALTALIFRLVVGTILLLLGTNKLTLALSGPLGSIVARIVLAGILAVPLDVLIMPALPGMLFTAVAANLLYPAATKIFHKYKT